TKYFSGRPMNKIASVNSPLATITTSGNQALVNLDPLLYIETKDRYYEDKTVKQTAFLTKYYGNGDNINSVNDPAGALTTRDRFSILQTNWLDKQFSGDRNYQSVNRPAGSILPNDKHCLMT